VNKEVGGERAAKYTSADLPDGQRIPLSLLGSSVPVDGSRVFRLDAITSQGFRQLTSVPYDFAGRRFETGTTKNWKTSLEGMARLCRCERIEASPKTLNYVRFVTDFPVFELTNLWADIGGIQSRSDPKVYAVQTATTIIQRCMQMTIDPGDLVLDPTCGSGTTAHVAEEWGRRWITIDVSRVALAIARQRILTTKYDYYQLRPTSAEDVQRSPNGTWLTDPSGQIQGSSTFHCKTVPHITLRSIARNQALDPIYDKWQPVLTEKKEFLNAALRRGVTNELRQRLATKLRDKQKQEGKRTITDADKRRWVLPPELHRREQYTTVDKGIRWVV